MIKYAKTGYLKEPYRLFHLATKERKEYEYHYHDFDKILLLIKGQVTYSIEGMNYELKPYDIVLVPAGQVHRPIVRGEEEYERIILYISPDYLRTFRTEEYDLRECFLRAAAEGALVLRAAGQKRGRVFRALEAMEAAARSTEYASGLERELCFQTFLIQLNRAVRAEEMKYLQAGRYDPMIHEVVNYLNAHMTEEISIDLLASRFFVSRSYLMHRFKEETGDTIGNYLTNKRLLYAHERIREGMPITVACMEAGFNSYSNFSRIYKRFFGENASN